MSFSRAAPFAISYTYASTAESRKILVSQSPVDATVSLAASVDHKIPENLLEAVRVLVGCSAAFTKFRRSSDYDYSCVLVYIFFQFLLDALQRQTCASD